MTKGKNPHWGHRWTNSSRRKERARPFRPSPSKRCSPSRSRKLSRRRLAERMGTSRSQIGRLLDPKDGNVTLSTLQRAAEILGRKVRLDLV